VSTKRRLKEAEQSRTLNHAVAIVAIEERNALRAERDAYLDVLKAIVKEARYSVVAVRNPFLMELVDLAESRIKRLRPKSEPVQP
jgi:fructose-1,6-bisphosphatase/sedoheptulose 1,7-bisphosphatase-like protein